MSSAKYVVDEFGLHIIVGLPSGIMVLREPGFPWGAIVSPEFLESYPAEGIDFGKYTSDPEVLAVSLTLLFFLFIFENY